MTCRPTCRCTPDAKGFTASTPAAGPGRKVYRWDYVPAQKARIEQGAVSYLDYGQYLAVSTFGDFATFAKAYDARAHSTLTPQIRTSPTASRPGSTRPGPRRLR